MFLSAHNMLGKLFSFIEENASTEYISGIYLVEIV